MAALVLIAGALLASHMRTGKKETSAAGDLAFVWRLSSRLTMQEADDRRWLIRYDVSGIRSGDGLRAAGLLGLHRSGGEATSSSRADRTMTYEGELVVDRKKLEAGDVPNAGRAGERGGNAPADAAESPDAQSVEAASVNVPIALYMNGGEGGAVVIVQPPAALGADGLEAAARLVEDALRQSGGHYNYSFRVSGSAATEAAVDAADLNGLMDGVIEEAEAKLVERYEDKAGAAISETRLSPRIGAAIETNGKQANLQLSVHRDSESGAADWVIGVPIITGDYAPPG